MNPISTLNDIRTIWHYRSKETAWQKKYDRLAPKAGDIAPDFTLFDAAGTHSVTLSDFRGKKLVALVFGSYT